MIVGAELTTSSSITDATSYATASISPTANRLVLLAVANAVTSGTPNAPTATGASMTWTQVTTVTTTQTRLTLFRALSSSPGSGAITIDFAGQTQTSCQWQISQFSGVITSGTNGADAIVQSATNNGTGTSGTTTLAAFGSTFNGCYGAFRISANETVTVGSGFTELNQVGTTEGNRLQTEWKNSNDTSVDASWTSNVTYRILAVEIKATPPTGFIGFF